MTFSIIENLNTLQIQQLLELFQQMWWTRERTIEDLRTMLANSRSFGLIEDSTQNLIGYARVLTDEIKYAFIFDVILDEQYRGKGLSKILMDAIFNHPKLKKVIHFDLTCTPDMVAFYENFNFTENFGEVTVMRHTRTAN